MAEGPEAKLEEVHHALQEELGAPGLEDFVNLLEAKGDYLRRHGADLGIDAVERIVPVVFGLRNKDPDFLRPLREGGPVLEGLRQMVEGMRQGDEAAWRAALAGIPESLKHKQRRALRNLAAELAHFPQPEAVYLDTAWVSGDERSMGALDYLYGRTAQGPGEIPQRHAQVRAWLEEQGFYRHLGYVQDVYYAQAYVHYMVEMTKGLGLLDQQFGQGIESLDYMTRLLGVDAASSRHWLQ